MKSRYGLVLAGGGTRGAYQVGAWKALKELGIKFDGIVGASIGAINGALFMQNSPQKIINLYNTITFNDIVKLSEGTVIEEGSIFNLNNIFTFAKEWIKNKGLDNSKIIDILKVYIDEDKLYKSRTDFGIVATAKNPKEQSLEVFKEDIPKEDIYDYILASSCYPIFKSRKLGDTSYVDGGIHDNIPVNMLLRKGYKKILVIDISDEGIITKLEYPDAYIKVIRPKDTLGGIFDFGRDIIDRNIKMGYLDTLKAFQKLEGNEYYFKMREYRKLLNKFGLKTVNGLELAAKTFEMDMYKIYSAKEFLKELYGKYNNCIKEYNSLKNNNSKTGVRHKDRRIGICSYIEKINTEPKFATSKTVEIFVKEFKEIGEALIELENYMQK